MKDEVHRHEVDAAHAAFVHLVGLVVASLEEVHVGGYVGIYEEHSLVDTLLADIETLVGRVWVYSHWRLAGYRSFAWQWRI
jgi:hypothetical protein